MHTGPMGRSLALAASGSRMIVKLQGRQGCGLMGICFADFRLSRIAFHRPGPRMRLGVVAARRNPVEQDRILQCQGVRRKSFLLRPGGAGRRSSCRSTVAAGIRSSKIAFCSSRARARAIGRKNFWLRSVKQDCGQADYRDTVWRRV
jgi:hypothetical protein